jgi:excisionase family DNA binding protein
MLGKNLTAADLPIIMDADEAAALLRCSKQQIELLADRGELPGAKYGRGWIFVTAQLLQVVMNRCAANLKARGQHPSPSISTPSTRTSEATKTPKRRGRPSRYLAPIPDEILKP